MQVSNPVIKRMVITNHVYIENRDAKAVVVLIEHPLKLVIE